jgi:hypothetical protein
MGLASRAVKGTFCYQIADLTVNVGGRLKACQLSLSLLSKGFDIQIVGRLLQIGMAVNRKQRKN